MPNHYTQEEQTAIARYFASGGKVTKLSPCCLQLKGAVPREEYSPVSFIQRGFNARRDGGHGETDARGQNNARAQARKIIEHREMTLNEKRMAEAAKKFSDIVSLRNEGVSRNEIMRRLKVGKETFKKAIQWAKEGGK